MLALVRRNAVSAKPDTSGCCAISRPSKRGSAAVQPADEDEPVTRGFVGHRRRMLETCPTTMALRARPAATSARSRGCALDQRRPMGAPARGAGTRGSSRERPPAEQRGGRPRRRSRRAQPWPRDESPGTATRADRAGCRSAGEAAGVDLVHAHYLLPYGYWAAQAERHPLVMSPWSRDIFVDAQESEQGRRRAVASIAAADFLVVNSDANRRASIELGADPDRIEEIIWYSELERFAPDRAEQGMRARLGWPEDALVVLSLRNFRPYTNLDVVLRAFTRLVRDEPRARLLLAARGGPVEGRDRGPRRRVGPPARGNRAGGVGGSAGRGRRSGRRCDDRKLGLDTGVAARSDGVGASGRCRAAPGRSTSGSPRRTAAR